MIKQFVGLRILLVFITCTCCLFQSYAQQQQLVKLIDALDIISEKHRVYFTYNPLSVKGVQIDIRPFRKLDLNKSVDLLKKVTPFSVDYLGNNYYVIYTPKKVGITTGILTKKINRGIDHTPHNPIKMRGIVLDEFYQPIRKVNIIEKNTQNGTISLPDGSFVLHLQKNNPIQFTHIGFEPVTIAPNDRFVQVMMTSGIQLNEVLIVGSRNNKRRTVDSPVATDVIDIATVKAKSEFININQFLQNEIPSFNATKQSGSDGADHIVPATYRGLGPDQTLVLINGKRRHQASLINLYGTRGRGNSGTDLNAIPAMAIKRIEVLKDGASAQYGSDAIAGVINVVLKDRAADNQIETFFGFNNAGNNSNPQRQGVDGLTYKTGMHYGTPLSTDGFVSVSAEFTSRDHTFRQGTSVRNNYGDARMMNSNVFVNAEAKVSEQMKFYANAGYHFKNTQAYAFTRRASSERNVEAIYPNGFNPLITSNITDQSLTAGLKGSYKSWNVDFSNTYGKNYFHYYIKETLNATLLQNSPKEFDAGGHSLSQNTTNIDLNRNFSSLFNGFNLALGIENRIEHYEIFAGEPASYLSYDTNGNPITNQTPSSLIPTHNGIIRPGGSQGFPGYSPNNEVARSRTSFGLYIDSEFDFTSNWLLATALRFEHYSDFGSTVNTKLATRLKINPCTTLRASFSTGFRAPSLAQIYYNLQFTNYIDNKPVESVLIANNNPLTQFFGIKRLKEEKAVNYSLGIQHKFDNTLQLSLDSYYIFIKDRIILSGNFDATAITPNVQNVQFFANGVNTASYGLDFRLNWHKSFDKNTLNMSFLGNLNKMEITQINTKGLDSETFFGIRERYFLKASAPNYKLILNGTWDTPKYTISANITNYSSVKLIDWQINKPLDNFNFSPLMRYRASLDAYKPKFTLDLHGTLKFSDRYQLQLGTTNLFNTYPTEQGENTDSGGRWDAVQMGSNGSFYYSKFLINF
ncbi:Iron complex outermembrane recepter protein [Tenacibaculum litopenaei]|uniref:TonB-dependent receptor n=1 Tax=Tenacibaculum litopenaei TaxID=396016 RepID=UPI0038948081